ncbi:inhibitor of nuclear factor kappa-B kinase subunit alpha-like [Babylonia areolata]|uniref:inhibitor of nuclear factor kappa-B kinase subunit alpha-like n=1 Tax=Babylonia areolata TaxID=304850 RepID=UPI003FD2D013
MLHHQQPNRRGPWLEEKTLGSGGFGTVVLWRNEETSEQVALKRCRVQHEMTDKHRQRWQLEVDIMKRLRHNNVVVALNVPPELDVVKEELPLLAMEYCSKGDLRKSLNLGENCCGMQEYEIRCLIHDVASALEYLHGKRIIHRDLKPENIVLQLVDEKIVYKLIDLGYAKELDQGSVCTSFVGTLQYLAPELFASKQYSQTVDYWSFGTVIFECITGTRPFLPTLPPVQWHKEVCAKSPDDICAWVDVDGVRFSKQLPPPFNLCLPMTSYLEQWLRLMLRWDPKQRGGGVVNMRPKCFLLLDQILNTKIVHVLHVEGNTLLSYPLKEDDSMAHLQKCLELETKIPVADQDLLLASGVAPDPRNPALQCWSEPSPEEWVVFLFRKKGMANHSGRRRHLPPMLQCIVKEPKTLLPFNEQRVAWAQAVYFLQQQNRDFKRLILSQRAAMLNLLRINTKFTKLKTRMMNELEKLMARKDHFKESLEFDIQQYNEQASGGVTSERMFSRWTRMGEDIEKYMQLKERAGQLESKSGAVTTKIVELQKSPFGKTRQNETLTDCEEKAKAHFHDLRQTPKEHRASALTDHNPMVQLVVRSVLCLEKAVGEFYVHLGKVMECRQDLQTIIPELERCIEEIAAAGRQLTAHQRSRQQDIWMLVKVALKQVKPNLPRSNSRGSSMPLGATSLSSMPSDHASTSLQSMRVLEDSKVHNRRLQEIWSSLMKEQEECMSILLDFDQLSMEGGPSPSLSPATTATTTPTTTPTHTPTSAPHSANNAVIIPSPPTAYMFPPPHHQGQEVVGFGAPHRTDVAMAPTEHS